MAEGENYRDILTENLHTICKYINVNDFLTELMSCHHLSVDDKERISNPYSNQTRREKAQHLVEVLMTKGPAAYSKFLEIMEYNYPEVFRELTDRDPRRPPPGFHRSRHSERIRLIDDLPEMAKNMQHQFKENLTISKQLEEFQSLLELSKIENNELDVENICLREKCSGLQKEFDVVKSQVAEKTGKLEKLQDDYTKNLHKMVVVMEELREYRDKQHELLNLKDSLTQQVHQLQQEQDRSHRTTSLRDKPSNGVEGFSALPVATVPPVNPIPPPKPNPDDIRMRRMSEKVRMLENNLEEIQEQNTYQAQTISDLQDEVMANEKELRTVKATLKHTQREKDALEKEKEHYLQKTNDYFKIIQTRDTEKSELEDEKLTINAKLRERNQEKSELFEKIHIHEEKMAELRLENEKLRARNSFNRGRRQRVDFSDEQVPEPEIKTETVLPVQKSNTLPPSLNPALLDIHHRMFDSVRDKMPDRESTQVHTGTSIVRRHDTAGNRNLHRNDGIQASSDTQMKPRKLVQIGDSGDGESVESNDVLVHRGGHSDLESEGSETSTDTQPEFTCHEEYRVLLPTPCNRVTRPFGRDNNESVLVLQPAFSHIQLQGGNHTGIFISQSYLGLKEGDQIMELRFKENDKEVTVSCVGKTLNDIKTIFEKEIREINVTVRRCQVEYESARKWMVENNGTGDFFYVRCNRSLMVNNRNGHSFEIHPGHIIQIIDSCFDRKKWLGNAVNKTTGDTYDNEYLIPKSSKGAVGAILRFNSTEQEDRSRNAFRVKGNVFDRVLPMKAFVKLPVALVGLMTLQKEMLKLLSKDIAGEYVVTDSAERQSFSLDQNYHTVRKCSTDKFTATKHVQDSFILLLVNQRAEEGALSKLFGPLYTEQVTEEMIRSGSEIQQKLKDAGKSFEEVCLSDLNNQQELMTVFSERVRASQDRILWLSKSEIDPVIADRNISLLGSKDSKK